MISKPILLRFILASCAFHVTVLSVAGFFLSGNSSAPGPTFAVQLSDAPKRDFDESRMDEDKKGPSLEKVQKEPAGPEETADLANPSGPYRAYLWALRKKIESLWAYPKDAYERRETGTTVVRFSIRNDGTLAGTTVLSSSGHPTLDRGALAVVLAAAPYSPFPDSFNLATLHVVAKFEYELD